MQKTKLSNSYEPGMPAQLIIHMDEAGRGPLAGPITVGAVIALEWFDRSIYQDSKTLTERKREEYYTYIQELQKKWSLVAATSSSSNLDIDEKGIIRAQYEASVRAIFLCLRNYFRSSRWPALKSSVFGEDQIAYTQLSALFNKNKLYDIYTSTTHAGKKLWLQQENIITYISSIHNTICQIKSIIYDGNHTYGLENTGLQVITIIKWDAKNPLISMASIIAKVDRDRYMKKISKKIPLYMLDQHKGYGTAKHREAIGMYGVSPLHRKTFCQNIVLCDVWWAMSHEPWVWDKQNSSPLRGGWGSILLKTKHIWKSRHIAQETKHTTQEKTKPKLLLHICCAPDLSRPLHWLKNHFKLYLFRYNPNIHPRKEHTKRYDSFLKLIGLEKWDYEIVEDWYDPKEFFDAMIDQAETIKTGLSQQSKKEILTVAWEMPERSDRCNPCYSMRLMEAARNAAKHDIPYFTSTLLISPKKKMDKLFRRWLDSEEKYPSTKFLWFNFAKNKGYEKATQLTKKHKLFRQNYCGCGWTIPKPGEKNKAYRWG